MLRRCLLLLLLAGLGSAAAPAARAQAGATLLGRTLDESDAPVQGVAVTLLGADAPGERRTVLTDSAGVFRFVGLPPGRYRVRADRLGYTGGEPREVSLAPGAVRRLDLRLRTATVAVEGVVVEGRRDRDRERARFEAEPGVTARVVEGGSLGILPGLAEADVLRAVELLPGVVSTSDLSGAYHVRGGAADQNLILLDGFPIFNPFHLGGLFSVFNADAVARAELFAGGFGVEHGGRVSSVLNVESRPAEEPGLEVRGGISLLATRLLLRAPLPDPVARALGGERGSWFVSGRRSYFDQLLRPWGSFPYHLADLQGFATLETGGGGRVLLTGYRGADVLDLSEYRSARSEGDGGVLRLDWRWGNRMLGVRWEQPLRGGWIGDLRLGYSAFSESLSFLDFGDVRFSGAVRQVSLRGDLVRDLSSRASVRLGAELQHLGYANRAEAGGTTFFAGEDDGALASGFASLRWRPDERWIVEPGLRLDGWAGDPADSRLLAAPRLAVKRFLGAEGETALKLAVGRYTQFLHSLRNEDLPVSNDTWVLSDRHVPPIVSDQLQLGVETFHGDAWSASAEAYLRTFRGLTEFNYADDPNDPGDDLLSGTGRAHGLDLLVRRHDGRVNGWVALSLLRARRTLPDPLAEGWSDLPPRITFPPPYDRRVDLEVVLQAELPRSTELGVRWNYGSPIPYTRPVAQYFAWRYSPLREAYEPSERRAEGPPLYIVLGPRNAERYPPYHRLDLTLRRTFRPRWGSWTPYLQVLNVYNRRNVLFYFYDYDRVPPTRAGISMFPVLPAIGVEVAF